MNWWKVLVYTALVLGGLLLVRLVASLILGVLGLLWAILSMVVMILVVGAVLYGGYRLVSWIRDNRSSAPARLPDETTADPSREKPANRVDDLKERYTTGELSEAELERRLEHELDEKRTDRIDRE